jgi:hypothetical protein
MAACYDIGRLSEARHIVSAGVALGCFPSAPALQWLDESVQLVQSHVEDKPWIAEHIPPLTASRLLLNIEQAPPDGAGYQGALRRLQLLRALADSYGTVSQYFSMMLFASDTMWNDLVGACRESLTRFAETRNPEALSIADSTLLDGANNVDVVCSHTLDLLRSLTSADETPLIGNRQDITRLKRRLIEGGHPEIDMTSAPQIELGLLLKIAYWKDCTEFASVNATSWLIDDLEEIVQALPPAREARLASNLGAEKAWPAVLWRIAPGSRRTLGRHKEVARLILSFGEVLSTRL